MEVCICIVPNVFISLPSHCKWAKIPKDRLYEELECIHLISADFHSVHIICPKLFTGDLFNAYIMATAHIK